MVKKESELADQLTLSATQFDEMKKISKAFLRVTAIGSIKAITKEELDKNVWLLDAAGLTQPEIERILGADQSTISRILSGKLKRKHEGEATR